MGAALYIIKNTSAVSGGSALGLNRHSFFLKSRPPGPSIPPIQGTPLGEAAILKTILCFIVCSFFDRLWGIAHTVKPPRPQPICGAATLTPIMFLMSGDSFPECPRQVENIDFIPLKNERYDLVFHKEGMNTREIETMLKIIRSDGFKNEFGHIGGYDISEMGQIVSET